MTLFKTFSGRMLVITSLILIVSTAWILFSRWSGPRPWNAGPKFPSELSDVTLPMPKPLVPFNLLDHNRKPFVLDNLKGHWTFLFFGYTHCPDVCPLAMGMLSAVFDQLQKTNAPAMEKTQGVFVSVDPKRDKPEHLKQYVLYFNPAFMGVTGSEEQIQAFTQQVGAHYFVASDFKDAEEQASNASGKKKDETHYQVSHTSAFFLIDPLGRLVAIFPERDHTDKLLEKYVRIRKLVKAKDMMPFGQ